MDEIFQLLDYLGIQSQSTIQTYAGHPWQQWQFVDAG